MDDHSGAMREALEAIDVPRMRTLWAHVSPHLPVPARDSDVIVAIHIARTQSNSVAFTLRAYSHRWLVERGYPSMLPDGLKPRAERVYPQIVEAVGIAVKASSLLVKPVAAAVQKAMGDAVEDAFADGRKDPVFVRARMQEARETTMRKLLGLVG